MMSRTIDRVKDSKPGSKRRNFQPEIALNPRRTYSIFRVYSRFYCVQVRRTTDRGAVGGLGGGGGMLSTNYPLIISEALNSLLLVGDA